MTRKEIKTSLLIITLGIFLYLLISVLYKDSLSIDTIVYNFISTNFINDTLTPIMRLISELASAIFLISIIIIFLIISKDKKTTLFLSIGLALNTILNQILKYLVHRPRPTINRLAEASGYSFPSGHSMASIFFYGLVIYLISKKVNNPKLKWTLISLLSLLILLIGFSRIYLGVHYTSDVLAGYSLSLGFLIVFIHFYPKRML